MADVFLSWFSPDKQVVNRLRNRLQSLCVDIWDYEHGMKSGDDIDERVRKEMLDAQAAIDAAPIVGAILKDELNKDDYWLRHQIESFTELAQGYLLN